ncbi:hypothetical protein HPG69_017939 [Diceros bicornis minor]|uniref:Uncharacterized protein n=1 Tax=Diceros bicornis minor TaxID=77932 RepID=A0A7J7F4G3_DICBM|nr:hypothetical protein HPG69_017939 [Diceros bicornis minor]
MFLLQTRGHQACEVADSKFVLGRCAPRRHWAQIAATLLLEVSPVTEVKYSEAPALAPWTIERSKLLPTQKPLFDSSKPGRPAPSFTPGGRPWDEHRGDTVGGYAVRPLPPAPRVRPRRGLRSLWGWQLLSGRLAPGGAPRSRGEPRGEAKAGWGASGRGGQTQAVQGAPRADARQRTERDEGWLVPGPPARGGGGCAALAAGSLSSAQEAGTWVGCGLRGARARISSISPLTRPRAAPQTAAAPAPPEPPDRRAGVLTAGPASPPARPAQPSPAARSPAARRPPPPPRCQNKRAGLFIGGRRAGQLRVEAPRGTARRH